MIGKIVAVLLIVVLGGVLVWYGTRDTQEEVSTGADRSIKVVATFYPLQELAKSVIGDLGEVRVIVPAGTEPHDFEPTPKDVKDLYAADLIVLNGAGMDPWAEKLVPELTKKGVGVLVLAQSVDLITGGSHHHEHATEETHGAEAYEEAQHEHEEMEDGFDPHFWLDPVIAQGLVRDMTQVLITRFPSKQSALVERSEIVIQKLQALDDAYRSGLMSCTHDEVVTSHNAFAYLAQRYGFQTHALTGLSPEAEPSAKRLAEIAAEAKEEGIKYIFFETLVNPKLSETLAREVGAETLVFNPIEGVTATEQAAGVNYFSLMEANLAALRKALECK